MTAPYIGQEYIFIWRTKAQSPEVEGDIVKQEMLFQFLKNNPTTEFELKF